jgi:AcrR family transcriptional regulator
MRSIAVTQDTSARKRATRAQTRARLLKAAGEVFAARGYHGASLENVAGAAGLTKGAVYSSFASKDELFYALLHERIAERLALVTEAIDAQATAGEAAFEVGRALAGLSVEQGDWHMLFIEFWAQAVRDPQRREEFARHRRQVRDLIAGFLERLAVVHEVTLPAPAEQLALAILALSNGISIERLADPQSVDPATFATTLNLLLGELASA